MKFNVKDKNGQLNLGDSVKINKQIFEIIGIDEYSLNNLSGKEEFWISYTIVSIKRDNERFWLTKGLDNKFIFWSLICEEYFPKGLVLDKEFSGFATIKIFGDNKYSASESELSFYKNEDCFFAVENFDGLNYNFVGKVLK